MRDIIKIIFISFLLVIFISLLFLVKNNSVDKSIMTNKSEKKNKIVRQAAVAGSFYPADPKKLQVLVNDLLNKVQTITTSVPQIIIVPHAGYVFSGQTAAHAFRSLESREYNNVIILGSSHNYPLQGMALYDGDAVATPLGKVTVARKLVNELIDKNDNIYINNESHEIEHSLEVQIPFLQTVLKKDWQVILGLINSDDTGKLKSIAKTLAEIVKAYPGTLIVISSDLAHYPSYDDAVYSDQNILAAVGVGDIEQLIKTEQHLMTENIAGLETCACGMSAIKVGLHIAEALSLKGEILHYSNSGDIPNYGDKSRIVGYGAVAFMTDNKQQTTNNRQQEINGHESLVVSRKLTQEEQSAALKLARNTLELAFGLAKKEYLDYQKYPIFQEKRGLFVTLKHGESLRGCIGLIEPIDELSTAIKEMSEAAAFDDPRFSAVTNNELSSLTIEVSVLTSPQLTSNPDEIELGRHGVIVKSGGRSGVFLPQVATETGWNLATFMSHLCVDKAGLNQECWYDGTAEVYTFEAQVFSEN